MEHRPLLKGYSLTILADICKGYIIALVKIDHFGQQEEGGRRKKRRKKNTHCDSNCRAGGGEWSLARTDEVGRDAISDLGRGKVVHLIVQHHTRCRHHIRTKVPVDRAVGKERGQEEATVQDIHMCEHIKKDTHTHTHTHTHTLTM